MKRINKTLCTVGTTVAISLGAMGLGTTPARSRHIQMAWLRPNPSRNESDCKPFLP
jgi:hypothetical protein